MRPKNPHFKVAPWASLVVQWLTIHMPMQGHRFDRWPRKISCTTATKLVRYNYWAHVPYSLCSAIREALTQQQRPNAAEKKTSIKNLGGFPGGASGKESACQYKWHKRRGFNPWVGKIPWRRAWLPTPVFLPGESHGQRSMVDYSS